MAEISANYFARFKRAIGDSQNPPIFEKSEVDDMWTEATEEHEDASDNALLAYTVLVALRALKARYATQVSYTMNTTSESLSDIARRYDEMIADWQTKLDAALASTDIAIRWGSTRRVPRRDEEYPDA